MYKNVYSSSPASSAAKCGRSAEEAFVEPRRGDDDHMTTRSHGGPENASPHAVVEIESSDHPHHHPSRPQAIPIINNSQNIYIPVKLLCGMQALCRPEVLSRCPTVLQDLDTDLTLCFRILPQSVHALIRRTKIWVNYSYMVGPIHCPKVLNHATTHHHEAWLIWSNDRADKRNSIEIYNCVDYQRMRLHWNGCGLILHELCHLIHQHVLHAGLDNEQVKQAYANAERSGRYDQVLRRDWAGKAVDCDMAYAMVDHREFFAEMSVSYWSRAYRYLDREDHTKMDRVSPPILAPSVRQRLLEKRNQTHHDQGHAFDYTLLRPVTKATTHCNKFYPFTRGQLHHYDRETFYEIRSLWRYIAMWRDGPDNACCTFCWHPYQPSKSPALLDVKCSDTVDL